ncbi:YbaB/EbfC family nucleoid-associated protein [Amycolatopsis rhabdoformis]|uniref:YbaB/EbfC family nucleoid-associated protein n=1 Tax=Amycolatopsis rhabdoformis TaxID=1448059 RepID=A0ABZ1I6A3_9PSEU|nr:YbaB/EbfC family nucleoid-associated protein [Amycolatopsis rhabdoformis]WSE29739.1 YbaB/EbfC family nucleoid-associated protein [Amycolatopsis rhabdoformis]
MDEQEWLDDFQRRVDEMRAKSVALQEKLTVAEGKARSADGLVAVTVTPSGALKHLHIDDRALRSGAGAQLTAAIMETYGKAQRQVSRDVADAIEPLAGGTEMMNVVRSFLPEPEPEDDEPQDAPRQPGEPEAEDRTPLPPASPRMPPPPPMQHQGPPMQPPVPPRMPPPPRPQGPPAPPVPPVPPAPQSGPPAQPRPEEQQRPPSGPHRRRMDGDDDEMQPW